MLLLLENVELVIIALEHLDSMPFQGFRQTFAIGAALGLAATPAASLACSRVMWTGPDQQVITGRSMDWPYGFNSHFHVIPRGQAIEGAGGVNSMRFSSRYGAVLVSGSTEPGGPVDAVFDGMNEKGLAANLL